jgi:glycosyltransferase involved in cell wall biosynthesis
VKLLFVCKRRPQGRDLLSRPYGRFHYLPALLAERGHDVRLLLVDHRGSDTARDHAHGLQRVALDLRRLGPVQLRRALLQEARDFRPDWVVGLSDAWAGWFAHALARDAGARLALDAYDNYESYMPWNLPLHALWHRALRAATVVTAAGPQLSTLLQRHAGRPVQLLPMAADPGFVPMDRADCRRSLGLPEAAPMCGYFGGWAQRRGTDALLPAFQALRARVPEATLVLSGHPPPAVARAEGVIALGYVADAQLPLLANAVDVSCVLAANSAFGRYSYPAKLCEAIACERPVVASATEAVRWMLADAPERLTPVGDTAALSRAMEASLPLGRVDYAPRPGWPQLAASLEAMLAAA